MKTPRIFILAAALAIPLAAPAADWAVRPDGIGSLNIGLPFHAIRIPLQQPIRTTDYRPDGKCFYAIADLPQQFDLMIEDGVVTRIDVMKPGVRTAEGIGVGDPMSLVLKTYGDRIKSETDFYDENERYLTILSNDGRYAIRFSTFQDKISSFAAGLIQSVKYVEGCL